MNYDDKILLILILWIQIAGRAMHVAEPQLIKLIKL